MIHKVRGAAELAVAVLLSSALAACSAANPAPSANSSVSSPTTGSTASASAVGETPAEPTAAPSTSGLQTGIEPASPPVASAPEGEPAWLPVIDGLPLRQAGATDVTVAEVAVGIPASCLPVGEPTTAQASYACEVGALSGTIEIVASEQGSGDLLEQTAAVGQGHPIEVPGAVAAAIAASEDAQQTWLLVVRTGNSDVQLTFSAPPQAWGPLAFTPAVSSTHVREG